MTTAPTRSLTPKTRPSSEDNEINQHNRHATLSDVQEDLSQLKQDMAECATDAAHTGLEAVKTGAAKVTDTGKKAANVAKQSHAKMCEYVSAHPTTAVLVAAGVGALVARLLPRR